MAEIYRWGMVIDEDRCTGCEACVVACHAENNIAVVGDDQTARARQINWIRVERYWEGEYPNVRVRFRPVLCQHCTNAPCEPVCPVYATYHNPDGLNTQIYNRCVGVRYCANNCPYRVRFFNWLEPRLAGAVAAAAEPGRHRAQEGPDREVHLLHPAHPPGEGDGQAGGPAGEGRRGAARLRADLRAGGAGLRRPERPEQPGIPAGARTPATTGSWKTWVRSRWSSI